MELQAGDLKSRMADYSTTAGRIPILFFWRLLGSTSATRRYKVRLYAVNTDGVIGLAISRTRWQITPQPLAGYQFCFLEVVGLHVSYATV